MGAGRLAYSTAAGVGKVDAYVNLACSILSACVIVFIGIGIINRPRTDGEASAKSRRIEVGIVIASALLLVASGLVWVWAVHRSKPLAALGGAGAIAHVLT